MYIKIKIILLAAVIILLHSGTAFSQNNKGFKSSGKTKKVTDHRLTDFNFNFHFLEGNKQKVLGNYEAALNSYNHALKVDETQSAAYYEIAGILNLMQDYSGSLEYAKQAVQYDKTNNEYYRLLLAFSYQNNNLPEKAAEIYQGLIKSYPEKIEYYFELAALNKSMGKTKEAIKILDNVEKKFGIMDMVSVEKERYYMELGDHAGALKEIKNLSDAFPENVKYKTILAETYVNTGDMVSARKIYSELENSELDEGLLYFSIADFYRMTKEYDKSFEFLAKGFSYNDIDLDFKIKLMVGMFEVMGSDTYFTGKMKNLLDILTVTYPGDLKVKALYSDYHVYTGDFKSAQKELDFILEREKDKFQIWSQALFVDYSLKDMQTMYKRSKEAVELYPNFLEFYKYYVISAYFTEHYDDVIESVNYASMLAVNDQPLLLDFLSMQGDAYHKKGKSHESDSVFDIVLSKDKDYIAVLNNYSYFLAERGEKLDKALEMSTRLISLEGDKPSYLDTHAWVLYKKGDLDKALEFVNKAIQMDSKNSVYLEHKGDILYKLNKTTEALEMWQMAKNSGKGSELLEEKIQTRKLIE